MRLHHNCLYKLDDNMPPKEVLKQELITYEQTERGLKISKLERSFWSEGAGDIYTSSPLPFKRWGKPKRQASEEEQRQLANMFNEELIVSVPLKSRSDK